MMTHYARLVYTFLILSLLAGCGFKLRGEQPLPHGIKQASVAAPFDHSPMLRALKKRFKLYQIPLVESQEELSSDTVHIQLISDQLDRRLLSLFSSGQVAEYELVFTVQYAISFSEREPMIHSVEVTREYQDDPDAVLAKSRELELVLSEMHREASDRIIRLMTNQRELAPLRDSHALTNQPSANTL
ncbi:LPS assembly lipoprotein LptE [Aestuariibacter sp. AA17]|uniref:LPS-assembly lipoprotein LptE n=1 Tax=Fluctibacter corallii TaxID=2984329 RepID=A0ABT3A5M0_9ALTE|nr:LPS assembly lipoprotein LptE [Aestuariibacter sp. AA17]MCV2883977.1 LPS assembly lipoprotein LptE [Aestuariibacter sp. AA17]